MPSSSKGPLAPDKSLSQNSSVGPRPSEAASGKEPRRGGYRPQSGGSAENIAEEERRSITPPQPAESRRGFGIGSKPGAGHGSLAGALVLLSTGALFLTGLGSGFREPDEGRYADIAWTMVSSGDWFVPRLNGKAHFDKPLLAYWPGALSMAILGKKEWAARLPYALAALGTVLCIARTARRVLGMDGHAWAGLALASTPFFFFAGHIIGPDILLTFLVTAGLLLAGRVVIDGEGIRKNRILFYLLLWLSFQVKGPVGLALEMAILLAFRLWSRRPFRASLRLRTGLPIVLVLSLPWFLWAAVRHPELWRFFFIRETLERVGTDIHGRYEPPWHYLLVFPLEGLPWSAVLLTLGLAALRGKRKSPDWRARWISGDWDRFLLCSFLGTVTFFSFPVSKQFLYVLPGIPPLVLWAARVLERHPGGSRALRLLAGGLAVVLWVLALGPMDRLQERFVSSKSTIRPLAAWLAPQLGPQDVIAAYGLAPRALPFYLGRRYWDEESSFDFQLDEDRSSLPNRYDGRKGLVELWRAAPRLWVIFGSEERARSFEAAQGRPVERLGRFGKRVVARNF